MIKFHVLIAALWLCQYLSTAFESFNDKNDGMSKLLMRVLRDKKKRVSNQAARLLDEAYGHDDDAPHEHEADENYGETYGYSPCHVCGPQGTTSTPDALFWFPQIDQEEEAYQPTCLEIMMDSSFGVIPEELCEFVTVAFAFSCSCIIEPTVSPSTTSSPSTSPAPSVESCFFCGAEDVQIPEENHETLVLIPTLGLELPCFILEVELLLFGNNNNANDTSPFGTCAEIQEAGKQCGCAPLGPTVSPSPSTSLYPSITPTSSPFPSASGPCFLCGADVKYSDFDMYHSVVVPSLGGDIPCSLLQDFGHFNYLPKGMKCTEVQAFSEECGCPPIEPTASPFPSVSPSPSSAPSLSESPSAGPCYLCGGTEELFVSDHTAMVTLPPPLSMDVYCHDLEWFLLSGIVFQENSTYTCEKAQAEFSDACGCPKFEPTASPRPSVSPSPSSSPSLSASPSASPCYLCGETEEPFLSDHTVMVTLPPPLSMVVYCHDLEWFLLAGIIFQEDPTYTCEKAQAEFADACGCPRFEPTASPAPSISSVPSVEPTQTSAPSAPCSCQGICHAGHFSCGCFCDWICKDLNDCCADVDDHCEFSGGPDNEGDFDIFGDEEQEYEDVTEEETPGTEPPFMF